MTDDPFRRRPVDDEAEDFSPPVESTDAPPIPAVGGKAEVTVPLTEDDIYYTEVNSTGNVSKYKVESGVPVKVADLGTIKDYFKRALQRAALLTPAQMRSLDLSQLTHIEIAVIRMAQAASLGSLDAINTMLDRVLGKPKQFSETTALTLTIDDLLSGVKVAPKGETIDA